MDARTRQIRKFIYETFRDTSHPPLVQHIMDRFELGRAEVVDHVKTLEDERQLTLIPGTERIFMAHPFSALATPFRARLRSGREYFINCALDTLALQVMLGGEAMTISSFCHHSGAQIEIGLADETVQWTHPGDGILVYVGVPAARLCQNIIDTCGNRLVFFRSGSDLQAWLVAGAVADPGEALTLEQTIAFCQPVYGRKMELDYQRPSAEVLNAHLRGMGLTGPFWEY